MILHNTRKILAFFLVSVAVIGCGIFDDNGNSVDNNDHTASAAFSYEISPDNRSLIRVRAINGTITIKGGSMSSVIVKGKRTVGSESEEDASNHLDDLKIQVSETSSEIRVETIQPSKTGGRDYIVDYDITVPANWKTNVSQVNGSITIGSMQAESKSEQVNGDIELINIAASADISLVNGTIKSQIIMPAGGRITHATVNGKIELSIPDTTSAKFSASVNNGNISLAGLNLSDPEISEQSVTGTLGDGSGIINLQVINGDIRVTTFQ
ncbi:MAG: DUF4097 family beta strand repeat-containing protein [Balneolaceae bacterium]|jgi:hypothetical protein